MKNLMLPDFWRSKTMFNPFEWSFRDFDREMHRMFDWSNNNEMLDFGTPCDVSETESHYLMTFDLPGMKKEDLKINLYDNVLSISGERRDESVEKGKNKFRSERYFGSFSRSFTLPASMKPEQIEAEYKDGVLRVAFPKIAALKGQTIKIAEGRPGFFDRFLSHKKEESKGSSHEKRPTVKVA